MAQVQQLPDQLSRQLSLADFIRRNRLPTAVVFTLLTLDFLALAMLCFCVSYNGRTFGIPTTLHPFTDGLTRGHGLNFIPLGLACSQVTLLTLWLLNGRAPLEIRWGALLLGMAACIRALNFFYGQDVPIPSLGVLFFAQVVSLLVVVALLRRRLFPQDQRDDSTRWKMQFSIRTLLLATTLIAIGFAIAPYLDLGILVEDPNPSPSPRRPLGMLTWPSRLDFLAASRGTKVVCLWKLLLGACCTFSALLSILATRYRLRHIPLRLMLAALMSSLAVVAVIWLAVDHQRFTAQFFYPPFDYGYDQFFGFHSYFALFFPWVGWNAIQVVIVSSVLLAFRWNRYREPLQSQEVGS